MFEEKDVILATIQKYQAILAKLIVGREIFAEQCAAGPGDGVILHIGDDLRHLLPDAANDRATRRLQLGQARFDDVSLLAAFEMLAALANPFLAFQNEVAELIADFEGEKLQQAQAEEQIDLDVFVIFGQRKRAVENL